MEKNPKCAWCGGAHEMAGCLLYIGAICGNKPFLFGSLKNN
jgi:hypothetical protein